MDHIQVDTAYNYRKDERLMSDSIISVKDVSKKFCYSLKRSLWYGIKDMGSELIGRNNSHKNLRKNEFWANRNVSFEVKQGESLGLIGGNGAGKTTLLRMLNGLIKPDTGSVEIRGRMQALIALGAGFNPILTGRENIYVNAAVLGITKSTIDKKFDEILDFSGIEKFIDTPVQSYSSGMKVRLGFAIAINMDPDILLVDEVLAVGDMDFRSKCRERIQKLVRNGVAIILVTHNMQTVSTICPRTIVLEKGKMIFDGDVSQAIDIYRSSMTNGKTAKALSTGTGEIKISNFEILNNQNMAQDNFNIGDHVKFRIHYKVSKHVENPVFQIGIVGLGDTQVSGIRTDVDGLQLGTIAEDGYIDIDIENFNLLPNIYFVNAGINHSDGFVFYDKIERISELKIVGGHQVNGTVYLPHRWEYAQLK